MKPENIRIVFDKNIFTDNVHIALIKSLPDGRKQIARLNWEDYPEATYAKPTFVVTNDYIKDGLIPGLNTGGFLKESEAVEGLKGKLRATTVHLTDMRSLVFKDDKGMSPDAATEALKENMR